MHWLDLDLNGQLKEENIIQPILPGETYITGESSANYFVQAHPGSIKSKFPDAKLILLIRNPADRAISHYKMLRRFQKEGRRLPRRLHSLVADAEKEINNFHKKRQGMFVSQGVYLTTLRKWHSYYDHDQLRIILSEDLAAHAHRKQVLGDLCSFLNIRKYAFDEIAERKFNLTPFSTIEPQSRELLMEFYRPYNTELENYLGKKLGWDS
jgi:hypothetical protein